MNDKSICNASDTYSQMSEVKQFHLKNGILAANEVKTVIDLKAGSVVEMCCIRGGNSLLFATKNRLVTFDTQIGSPDWGVTLNQPGLKEEISISAITTDALGHFFVCDTKNKCVHVFSDDDGEHLGILLKKEDGDIGVPHKIGWNHKSGLLVVTHKEDDSRFMVSIYKV